jgi:accessory gene regulator B
MELSMYKQLIHQSVDFICKYKDANEEDQKIYSYGLDLIFMSIVNAGILLVLGVITQCLFETALYLVGFSLLQSFGGGYHAMTHLRCFTLMLINWFIAMLIIPFAIENPLLLYGSILFGAIIIFILSPIKHVNFPLSKDKEKKMIKIVRIIAILYCITALVCRTFLLLESITAIISVVFLISGISMLSAYTQQILKRKKCQNRGALCEKMQQRYY